MEKCPIEKGWDIIISIFAHTPPNVRKNVHKQIHSSLNTNGLFILEAYTPLNIGRGTNGPQDIEPCMTSALLRDEIGDKDLVFERLKEMDRIVNEGKYHHGLSHVVQLIAKKI